MTAAALTTDGRIEWEQALVKRATQGDALAFERLYREHAGRVFGLCLRLTRDRDKAEDCVQETFINAWRALGRFETRSSLATWLHRIAVNVVLARRRRHTPSMTSLDDSDEPVESHWTLDTPVEIGEIEAAIENLPEGARDVLVLSGIYGYAHQETAEMLGIAVGTCKAQLHRARKLLQERLSVEIE